ncbi:MAG: hypothetical protein Ta2A_10090 [Treponemataceae bacterium]|nr:MAG: hypothetical protein Ta2A_10090 [Treponemataceae bacterium]
MKMEYVFLARHTGRLIFKHKTGVPLLADDSPARPAITCKASGIYSARCLHDTSLMAGRVLPVLSTIGGFYGTLSPSDVIFFTLPCASAML